MQNRLKTVLAPAIVTYFVTVFAKCPFKSLSQCIPSRLQSRLVKLLFRHFWLHFYLHWHTETKQAKWRTLLAHGNTSFFSLSFLFLFFLRLPKNRFVRNTEVTISYLSPPISLHCRHCFVTKWLLNSDSLKIFRNTCHKADLINP